jgi:WD40 repeat protein
VAIGDRSGQISIYNLSSLSLIRSFQAHSWDVEQIKPSPFKNTSNFVATCSFTTVKIWDSASNWSLIRTYSQHSTIVLALDWVDADTLASCGYTNDPIRIWSVSTGQTRREITTNFGYVYILKLLSNGIHLAAGGFNPYDVRIFNINDGSLVATLKGHTGYVLDLAQVGDDLLASASEDRTVRIWNLTTTNSTKFTLQGHTYGVYALKQISSQILASASFDSTLKLWNITSGQEMRTLRNHTGGILRSLDLIENNIGNGGGQTWSLVSGGYGDKSIKVWSWMQGECLQTIQTNSTILALAVVVLIGNGKSQVQQTIATTTTTSSNTNFERVNTRKFSERIITNIFACLFFFFKAPTITTRITATTKSTTTTSKSGYIQPKKFFLTKHIHRL